ncbi:MAG: superoxide dismutase family protein [Opitutaceae bacterium]|nr:superoxide dismutase family protein [Opitutaceae bacterium]
MKNRYRGNFTAAVIAVLALGVLDVSADDKRMGGNQDAVKAAVHAQGQSARELIGQDVVDRAGNKLGEINDIVVNTKSGKAVFATIGTGGVLGIGERVRAVPFSKLSQRADKELQLDVDGSRWTSAPQLKREEISVLNDQRGGEIFNYYEVKWNKDMAGPNTLAYATHLSGKDLMNSGQEVGDVEDVIVNLNNQRASLLIDPNDNFTRTNEKFVVSLNKVSGFGEGRDELMTQLSPDDFIRATPADRDYWDNKQENHVYRWSAYVYPFQAPMADNESTKRDNEKRDNRNSESIHSEAAAMARLSGAKNSNVTGTIQFIPVSEGVRVVAYVRNLSEGEHGFHIHEKGDLSADDLSSAGDHFNPGGHAHGGPKSDKRHAGDLGNLSANSDGIAKLDYVDRTLKLDGNHSIIGKSVIVHESRDDLKSQPSGGSGARIAGGVIERVKR